jgi:hypothetical protein
MWLKEVHPIHAVHTPSGLLVKQENMNAALLGPSATYHAVAHPVDVSIVGSIIQCHKQHICSGEQ